MRSKSVTNWCKFFPRCEEFVRIIHTCEKYEVWILRFNKALLWEQTLNITEIRMFMHSSLALVTWSKVISLGAGQVFIPTFNAVFFTVIIATGRNMFAINIPSWFYLVGHTIFNFLRDCPLSQSAVKYQLSEMGRVAMFLCITMSKDDLRNEASLEICACIVFE